MPLSAVGGSTTTSNTTANNALDELARIREQVEELRRRQEAGEDIGLDNRDKDKVDVGSGPTPGREVREFVKYSADQSNDTLFTARDIGQLVPNNSRLNLFTSLRPGDRVDHFSFNVFRSGEMRLGQFAQNADEDGPDKGIRVQLLDRMGRVLADSGAPEGSRERVAFEALSEGEYRAEAGRHYLRVTREEGDSVAAARGNSVNYSLQLTMGTYHNDYDTIERGMVQSDQFELPIMAQGVIQSLTDGMGMIASLPPIGQSATQKLMGHFIDQMF